MLDLEKCSGVITTLSLNDPSRYGSVSLDKYNKVIGFHEKKETDSLNRYNSSVINAGVYLLHKELFGQKLVNSVFSLENDVLPKAIDKGLMALNLNESLFIDIGIPETLAVADLFFRKIDERDNGKKY